MFQHGEVIGAFGLAKFEVAPFDADDIALVETFAAQAAIAIENVRQFKEVQTRLEREVASREILDVISRSQDDEAPVFDTVLRRAATLCGAPMASLNIVEEDRRHGRLVAHWGEDLRLIEVGKTLWQLDVDLGEEDYTETSMRDGVVMQCHDLKDTDRYRSGHARRREMVDVEGIRTFLAVPLIRRGQAIGNIALYRREVQPFTDDQIALVETFAAQAVIAIENVRQFEEVQTRLEREAATREILQVISQSPDDEHPVFHAILKNASRLCDAPLAFLPMANEQRTHVSVPAFRGVPDSFAAALNEFNEPMEGSGLVAVRAVAEARVIRSADLFNDPEFPASGRWRTELVEREGARSVLVVPLLRDGVAVGAIMLYRREIRPFSDDEVELIRGFAAQAVIAVENVRQFRALEVLNAELGDRVEEQVSEIERMGRLKRFLPAAVADTVVSSGSDSMLSSHRALLGVLFCDIRGFTAFCETAEPEETIEVLQTYHEEMGKLINAHGAGVDHRMGDGIMVLFNDPLPCDDPAGDAVRLGMAMQSRMSDLCTAWKRMGYRLGFGVGVSLGYATVGMVGFEGRFDYTASGTAINLASRLCDEAEDGEILLSPRAAIAVEDAFRVESRGELTLKGLREPLEVFRLTGTDAT
jgi:GAF domain-containing protein